MHGESNENRRIGRELKRKNIQWYFNPPTASHQGGVLELLIRSVQRILHSMVSEHLVNEETLTTFLVEVQKILNGRPITRVSSDRSDLDALTPNHILLLRHNPCTSPGEFGDMDRFQARWKHMHVLANEFWQRWVTNVTGTSEVAETKTEFQGWGPSQETVQDSDGIVRQVFMRNANGVFRRDIRELCVLEEELLRQFEAQEIKD